jgi:hypothetical protein
LLFPVNSGVPREVSASIFARNTPKSLRKFK